MEIWIKMNTIFFFSQKLQSSLNTSVYEYLGEWCRIWWAMQFPARDTGSGKRCRFRWACKFIFLFKDKYCQWTKIYILYFIQENFYLNCPTMKAAYFVYVLRCFPSCYVLSEIWLLLSSGSSHIVNQCSGFFLEFLNNIYNIQL